MSEHGQTDSQPQHLVGVLGAATLWAVVLGGAAAIGGVISGLVLAAHRRVIDCPDGTIVDDGQDPNCYSYPDVAQGLGIAFGCVALLVLIVLATRVLLAVSEKLQDRVRVDAGPQRPGDR